MDRILKKISVVIIFLIIILFVLQHNVFAGWFGDVVGTIDEGWGYWMKEDGRIDIDVQLGQSGAESSSKAFTEKILGVFQVIGSIISVIALCIIGIRYMCSSVEEKAQMKGILIYYIIGALLVFATSNLLGIAYSVINGLSI